MAATFTTRIVDRLIRSQQEVVLVDRHGYHWVALITSRDRHYYEFDCERSFSGKAKMPREDVVEWHPL